jgi:hypothetical protein
MRFPVRTTALLVTGLMLAACQASESMDATSAAPPVFETGSAKEFMGADAALELNGPAASYDRTATAAAIQGVAPQVADAMVVHTGDARIQVDSLERAVMHVQQLATQLGGSVHSSTVLTGERQRRGATLTIKVPAARFDDAMRELRNVGRPELINVQAVDVGEEFVDISARLEAARQLEARLLEILRTRTGKLDEVLAVERELARVRAEIERYEGRLRYLSGRLSMARITAALHEGAPLVAGPPGESVLGAAAEQAWINFVGLLAGTIALLGFLLPLALVLAFATWLWRGLRTGRSVVAS